MIRDPWFSKIEALKIFLKICHPLEFFLQSVIRDPWSATNICILLFWLFFWLDWDGYDSVIRDQWVPKIEALKKCVELGGRLDI